MMIHLGCIRQGSKSDGDAHDRSLLVGTNTQQDVHRHSALHISNLLKTAGFRREAPKRCG
jgi:hypothetical protein